MFKKILFCLILTPTVLFASTNDEADIVITPVNPAVSCRDGQRVRAIHVTKMISAKKVQEDDRSLTLEFELSYFSCTDLAAQPLAFMTDLAFVDFRAAPSQSQKTLSRFNFVYPSIKVISVQATMNKVLAFEKKPIARYGLALYPYGDVKSPHDFGGYSSTWIIDLYKDGNSTKVRLAPLTQ
ncbi:MAG: hypothetical protein AABZ31_02145 [Bdellovibrionota bacterium]|mgnify:CR=1 FL=1